MGKKGDTMNLISIFTFWFCHGAVEGAQGCAAASRPASGLLPQQLNYDTAANHKYVVLQTFHKGNFM